MELIKENVKVEWVELSEGLNGEYNPENLDDVELLRFDVSRKENKEWVEIPNASYCTIFPVSATDKQKQEALECIMAEIFDHANAGFEIKRTCERLSWIDLSWVNSQIGD